MRKWLFTTLVAWTFTLGCHADGWDPARPWTFWYWMYGAVSKAGIKADLEGMSRVGLGGCYLMPIYGTDRKPEHQGEAQQLTPAFWEMVDYALATADSLGLRMGIHLCDGFALAGGPWITPEESMQRIVFTDTIIDGGTRETLTLRRPTTNENYYNDIAVYALPLSDDAHILLQHDTITWSASVTRDEKGTFRSNDPCWIQYEFKKPTMVRNIVIHPSGNNIQSQRLKLSVSDDGEEFEDVVQMSPARQGWQDTGFTHTFAIPPTKGRFFRFCWTPDGTEPGSEDLDAAKWRPNLKIKDIELSSIARVHQWEGKAGYVWRVAPESTSEELPTSVCSPMKSIHRLTLNRDRVTTTLPTGRWLILRIGHTSTGHTNATGGGGKGLECDKFSAETVEKQINNWFGEFMNRPHSSVIRMLHVDSWECGSQNWSKNFASEFKKRRGYDLMPWLPLMAGYPINNADDSERVLRDIRKTINDLVNENFFTVVERRAHEYNCQLSSESMAPTMVSDGLDHFRYADIPMGEYWLNSPTHDKPNDMMDAISGAHIYGKQIVQGEGFTEVRGVWDETPALVKPLLDLNLALGMNRLVFHVNTHNPWTDRRPGMTLDGIGLFFQRDQTWYEEAVGLVDYITECQRRLQSGVTVSDIAVFTGEEMPSRSLLPDRLVNMLPGLIGKKRYLEEKLRLQNTGQPMEESPVGVNHSAGILKPQDWVNPLRGYKYDCINKDALLRLATVSDKCLCLPGGARYRVFVLPAAHPMNPSWLTLSKEVLAKVKELREGGVVIIDELYTDEDLKKYGVERDVEVPEGIAWTHIHCKGTGELYFLSNQQGTDQDITASFRSGDYKNVRVYDPLSKHYLNTNVLGVNNPRTIVTLHLPANGSVFVELIRDTEQADVYDPNFNMTYPLDGEWDIKFLENGVNEHTNKLFDWSQSSNDKIRYYSGHARYTTHVPIGVRVEKQVQKEVKEVKVDDPLSNLVSDITQLNKTLNGDTLQTVVAPIPEKEDSVVKEEIIVEDIKIRHAVLRLGEVRDVARVRVNGVECGIAWTAPYEVDITQALKTGDNIVEIEVVNTWANALLGLDNGTPPYKGIWTNAPYRMKSNELLPAGLLSQPVIAIEGE